MTVINDNYSIVRKLIQDDAKYIYTLVKLSDECRLNYIGMAVPYIGIFADSAELWGKRAGYIKTFFDKKEKETFAILRNRRKWLEISFREYMEETEKALTASDRYYSSLSNPLKRFFRLYSNAGVDYIGDNLCGNSLLRSIYIPSDTPASSLYEAEIEKIGSVAEKLCEMYIGDNDIIDILGIRSTLYDKKTNRSEYIYKEYNFYSRCPLKKHDITSLTLFSILCSANFLLDFMDQFYIVKNETKLRFIYVLYCQLTDMLKDINKNVGYEFKLNEKWYNRELRYSMMHYELGQILNEDNIIQTDPFGGATDILLKINYITLLNELSNEIKSFADQLTGYLL